MVTFELSLREESKGTYVKYLKDNELVNVAKKRQTHREIKLVVTSGERDGPHRGRGLRGTNY